MDQLTPEEISTLEDEAILEGIAAMTSEAIREKYSSGVIIIDETHPMLKPVRSAVVSAISAQTKENDAISCTSIDETHTMLKPVRPAVVSAISAQTKEKEDDAISCTSIDETHTMLKPVRSAVVSAMSTQTKEKEDDAISCTSIDETEDDEPINTSPVEEKETKSGPKTFVELYRLGCKLSNDPSEEHTAIYQDLDNLIKFVKEHSEFATLKYSISGERVCIVIPYELFGDRRRPPDSIIDGEEVIYASPGFDGYVSSIIDHMDNSYMSPMHRGNKKQQVKWKLAKLDLALTDWEAYVKRYLKPFESSEAWNEYCKSLILNSIK